MAATSLPEQLARTRRFALGAPGQFTISPDGATVLFLRSRAGDDPVACLRAVDVGSGTERLLADPADLTADPGTGIGSYATDRDARLAAFALAGELWTAEVTGGRPRRLPAASPVAGPRPDPAGTRIAYLSGGAVRVIAADGAADRVLAAPDGPAVTFGTAELTATTSVAGPRGFWWAPDGTALLTARTDSAAVPVWHLSNPAEPASPPRAVRYPAAGMPGPGCSLWICGLDVSRTEARWDHGELEYLVGAGWDGHGPFGVVQSRDQRTVRMLAIDPATGTTTVLAEQRDDCWVQLVPGLPARTPGGALLWHADLAGTRHLTVDGVPVTPPGLQLRAVLSVDGGPDAGGGPDSGDAGILLAASRDPAQTHLWSYRPGSGLRQLSTEPGVHTGTLRASTLVHSARCADEPAGRCTVSRPGGPDVPVASLVQHPVLKVRVRRLVLGPRQLRAALFLPSWHRPEHGPLPVLVDSYGGAGSQRVTAALDWWALVSQWFAEQGFAVLATDGSGTAGRGPAWEREVHGDPFGPVLEDQVAALHEAARLHPELDLSRAGIRGWSFSGTIATLAVLRRPDVFRVAVAGAGVTDQRLYNAHWRERTLGHPDQFPERYEACSLIRAAPQLSRPLLLIHGLADENVFAANTLRLSSALVAAGRPHEVLLLPGAGHSAIGSACTGSLLQHQLQFLRRHLMAEPGPGDGFRVTLSADQGPR
ncbi:MAG TPA: prolyl oligopeptidase family serine peptidase [Streptosporangiaceae bacterium]|nr:prolyl oligopeptidase family serine peptidase [Streptosporangiaceae bacterium]